MNELPSTEFRKTFAKLEEETLVTVNGHPIGMWSPTNASSSIAWVMEYLPKLIHADVSLGLDTRWMEPIREAARPALAQMSQAQRDELLNKINKGK